MSIENHSLLKKMAEKQPVHGGTSTEIKHFAEYESGENKKNKGNFTVETFSNPEDLMDANDNDVTEDVTEDLAAARPDQITHAFVPEEPMAMKDDTGVEHPEKTVRHIIDAADNEVIENIDLSPDITEHLSEDTAEEETKEERMVA